MSAPGIQLSSEAQFTYFEPSVRQYLQNVEQAVVSQNVATARQAFSQLDRTVRAAALSSARVFGSQHSEQVISHLQTVGAALESGDLPAAGRALNELQQHLSGSPAREAGQTGGDTPAENDSSESSRNLNVRI